MTGTVLMTTTAIVALLGSNAVLARAIPSFVATTAGKAQPPISNPKAHTLYSQNSNDAGIGVDSQNFTSGTNTSYSVMGADDIVIPAGSSWKIRRVDVTGVYFNGSGPAKSVNVIFWNDDNGIPGTAVNNGAYDDLHCAGMETGSFSCRLPKRLKLLSGHYWVTVQANCSFTGNCGEWGWELNSVIRNDPAVWECCYDVCPTWGPLNYCVGYNDDFMFDLKT